MATTSCPQREQLEAFAGGSLVEQEAVSVAEHLDACVSCDETVRQLECQLGTQAHGLRRYPANGSEDAASADDRDGELARVVQELYWAPQVPEPRTESLPRRLGQYLLLQSLPGGGMGQVYKAQHVKLGSLVAVKLLPQWRLADPQAVERFEQEMQAAGKLIHAHIVRALDAGVVDGVHYLAMEFVEGLDLSEVARRCGPLRVPDACELIRQAALGLQHLHEHELVHRDLKPSNLMLTPDGTVKILDLGLALLREPRDRSAPLTVTGNVMGTLDYMAPEQADNSHAVDIRADLYSLGATLYRLLTGRAPLEGSGVNTPLGKLQALATLEPASVRKSRPDVPPDLARVLARLLAKTPAQRFAGPSEMAAAVAPFAPGADLSRLCQRAHAVGPGGADSAAAIAQRAPSGSEAIPLPTAPDLAAPEPTRRAPRARLRRSALFILPVALGLLGLGIWYGHTLWLFASNQGRITIIIEVAEGEEVEAKLVVKHGQEQVEILDLKTNRKIVLRAQEYGLELVGGPPGLTLSAQQLSLRRGKTEVVRVARERPPGIAPFPEAVPHRTMPTIDAVASFCLPHDDFVTSVMISADGRTAVSGSIDNSARLWNLESRKAVQRFIGHRDRVQGVALSPDGKKVLTCGRDRTVRLWAAETGNELRQFAGHADEVWSVSFSPRGQRALSASGGEQRNDGAWVAGRDNTIRIWDVNSGTQVVLLDHDSAVLSAAFSPDETRILSGSADHLVRVWDAQTGAVVQTLAGHTDKVSSVAFSPDGHRAISGSLDNTVCLWDVKLGRLIRRLEGHTALVSGVAYASDGRHAASASYDATVLIWDVDGGRPICRLIGCQSPVHCVAFGPNSSTVLAGSGDHGRDNMIRMWELPWPTNPLGLPGVPAPTAIVSSSVRFQQRVTYRVGDSPRSVVAADFDGDGDPDLAAGNAQTVSLLLNGGNGTFHNSQEFPAGDRTWGLAVGDFDGDRQPDLAAANGGSGDLAILTNKGGQFVVHGRCTARPSTSSAVAADLNRDGRLDLAAVAWGGGIVQLFLGRGDATFSPGQTCAVGTSPRGIAVADFDGDHVSDLAVCNIDSGFVSLLWGQGDGTFAPAQAVQIGAGTLAPAPGDFNGDGRLDLAVTSPDAVWVLLGRGERSFHPAVRIDIAGTTEHQALVAADLNGDGVLDLLSGKYLEHCLLLMLGLGDGTFQPPLSFPAGTLPIALTVTDLNTDGVPDVALVNADAATVSVLLQQPGSSAPRPTSQPATARNPFGLPDVTGADEPEVTRAAEQAFAVLKGGDDDENAALWAMVSRRSPTSLDGEWSSRWKCPDPQCGWHTGLSRVQAVGERVFIVHRDLGTVYLIEARREGDRLIGKYQNARSDHRRDAFPWFGRIVDGERIDGVWRHGNGQFLRWDLRRRLAAVSDK